ncbi:hypothetical protein BDR26DRAFT_866764 [Obelidium mucronatum]|nr:hypothetical protein BDR26DRAFT_866764 [Obelidium mucronatum]
MNVAFCYLAFRVVSAWRAVTVGARVQNIVDLGRVSFTESQQFQKRIKEVVASVENDLANNSLVEGGGVGGAPLVWKWDGKGDLHDLVLERLEKEYGMYEWVRTYRRTRMVHFIHDRKIE